MSKQKKRALVLGAGSGRDIASAVLMVGELRREFEFIDLAGFLTPWAVHTFEGRLERPINTLSGSERKFIPGPSERPVTGFFETLLPDILRNAAVPVQSIFLFSLHYGTDALAEELRAFVAERGYDTVVVVDVGGDILGTATDHATMLTPLVDFACLELVVGLPREVEVRLAVIVPGITGEVSGARLCSIVSGFESSGLRVYRRRFSKRSPFYRLYESVNTEIEHRTAAVSHTHRLISVCVKQRAKGDFRGRAKKVYHIEDHAWPVDVSVHVPEEFMNSVVILDARRMHELRPASPFRFESVLEGALQLREQGYCGTEVDLSFVPSKFARDAYQEPVFLLTPANSIAAELRVEMIRYGGAQVAAGYIPRAIVFRRDADLLRGVCATTPSTFGDAFVVVSR